MFTRKLGDSGIEVSALGLGCWAIGGNWEGGEGFVGWREIEDNESIRALHAAIEHGITFFDTADCYGAGHSEIVLGKAIAGNRNDIVIATKFGHLFDSERRAYVGKIDTSPEYMRQALEGSLRRLGTDYIDLYQFHVGEYLPEEAVQVRDVLEEFVKEGKIRGYAWSTDDVSRAKVFAEGQHCIAVQMMLNVLDDNPELLAFCEAQNLASINRSPLAMGLLTGKYDAQTLMPKDDLRGEESEWIVWFEDGKPTPAYLEKLAAVREILTSNGRSLVQGALAWLWGRSPVTIPIPGFKNLDQAVENAQAMRYGPLTSEQIAEIDQLLGHVPATQ
jgi:aryl-alcohol dehydrogenase-like predicted oxidoreductase